MKYVKMSDLYIVADKGFGLCINSQKYDMIGLRDFKVAQSEDDGLCDIVPVGGYVHGVYLSASDLILGKAKNYGDSQIHDSYIDGDLLKIWQEMVKSDEFKNLFF